jgi:hypothetical protein
MKKVMLAMAMALALAMSTVAGAFASLSQEIIYEQDFSIDADDWSAATHNAAEGTATIAGSSFSYFGGTVLDSTYRQTWPELGYLTELDVYVDPAAMDVGDGFDLTVASSTSDGSHLRDFIFHLGKTAAGDVLVNGSNNSDYKVNEYKLLNDGDRTPTTITDAGWYTFQHSFYELDGSLAVDLNVLHAAGDVIFTTTRNNVGDLIDGVGGARYMWFTFVTGSIEIDNQSLAHNVETPDAPSSKDECKKGGFEAFGFDNQGQCIASVQANENAGM